MECVEVVVDGTAYQTWVADGAHELHDQLVQAAHDGAVVTLTMTEADGDELVDQGTLVLRLGSVSTLVVRLLGDPRTGAAMGISQ